jgi:hypothetical protein
MPPMTFVAWLTSFLVGLVAAPLAAWTMFAALFGTNSSSGYDVGWVLAPALVSPVYLVLHPWIFVHVQRTRANMKRAWWSALLYSVLWYTVAACVLKGYWQWGG